MDKRIKEIPIKAYVTTDGKQYTGNNADRKANIHQLYLDKTAKVNVFET